MSGRSTGSGGAQPLSYFERQYADDPDPWGFETRWYEQRKRRVTLALLPEQRYASAIEPGCANGALTEALAERCDRLVAFDPMPGCVARARDRLADQAHVRVEEGGLPEHWPADRVDLVVLSEVAYYLDGAGADALAGHLQRSLEPGGTVLAVHWTGPTDYPRTAQEVHDHLGALPFLGRRAQLRDEQFDAVVWTREDVAREVTQA